MYNHPYMDPDVDHKSLQRKVQFDIHFFFCRRGSENVEDVQVSDFKIGFNTKTETWYVQKIKDELTKNHKEAENIVTGLMPENKDDCLCPVRSFRKYLEHLEPNNPYLWQTPLKNGKKKNNIDIWYGMQHMGKNTLSGFMKDVSKECQLSQIYTNHSIRVTGITVLTRQNFTNSEIMAVSGHKLVQSLVNYQKTRDTQKLEMGNVLFQSMTTNEENIQRKQPKEICSPQVQRALLSCSHTQRQALPMLPYEHSPAPVQENKNQRLQHHQQDVSNELVPLEPNFDDQNVSDMDLLSALCAVEDESRDVIPTTSSNSMAICNKIMNNLPQNMFAHCSNVTIGSINFNISK